MSNAKGHTNVSTHPETGVSYAIPDTPEDQGLDAFLAQHPGKQVVVVQGLGFVGAVMSLVCANALTREYAVVGVDLPRPETFWKVRSFNEGIFPVRAEDPEIDKLFRETLKKGNFYATFDNRAYAKADVVVVDINLDVNKIHDPSGELVDFSVNMDGFKRAIEEVGMQIKPGALILVESTIPPGTCSKIIRPILDQCMESRDISGTSYMLGHSYERVMPGPNYVDSIRNFYRVYAGIDEVSANATEAFLKTIIRTDKYPLTRLENPTASEMAKVLENSYRAMNIAFITEWSRFAEESGVNLYEVVDAIRLRPTHSNMMYPGIGVGGYCLTKDALLASWSRKELFDGDRLEQSENGIRINDRMPLFAFNYVRSRVGHLRGKNILLFGVSYRQDVADTRSSPVAVFYENLKREGARLLLHDPQVRVWEEKSLRLDREVDELLAEEPDIIIFSTAHNVYGTTDFLQKINRSAPKMIFDLVGIIPEKWIHAFNARHRVKVLGRGDI